MRTLLVLDDDATPADVTTHLDPAWRVDLFPLTTSWAGLDRLERALGSHLAELRLLDAARELDGEVEALRTALPAWSAAVGSQAVAGRTVSDWLYRPSLHISAFWLGSIAEKNPLKTPELFVAAQARALDRRLASGDYTRCVHFLGRSLLGRALVSMARARGVPARGHTSDAARAGGRRVRAWLEGTGRLGNGATALAALGRLAFWGLRARGLTMRVPARRPTDSAALLFVTYFPYVDRDEAERGRFRNRYAGPLQCYLEEAARPVWWLGLFVFVDGWCFADAVRLARRFVAAGERLALVEAYATPSTLAAVLIDWLRVSWRAGRLRRALPGRLADGLLPEGAEVIAARLWRRSYEGVDLMRGLAYAALFRRAVAAARGASRCLYYCEMQSWEHGLVAAARAAALPTVGYQHTSVSRNYYFYSHASTQVARREAPDGLPLPDVLAASGERPAALLAESGYPGLTVVESVRFLGLREALATTRPRDRSGPPVVLVAGSIIERETAALLALVARVWGAPGGTSGPTDDEVTLWLKGHPSQPIAQVARRAGVPLDDPRYTVKTGDIRAILPQVDLVVVPTSAVAIEALAYGCEIVVPVFAAFPAMTPLAGFDRYYTRVYSPDELRDTVARFRRDGPAVDLEAKRAFVRSYWCLDPSLSRWRRLLGSEG